VSGIVWGRFSNAGQTCAAPKRVFVAAPIYDRFLDRLAAAVSALRVGARPGAAGGPSHDECDLGPLIHPRQLEEIEAQLRDAVTRGARVVAGGARRGGGGSPFFAPTVLADVTPDMRVMREETFGPLLPVMRVRDADEAVAAANASAFGLSASVWGRDARRAAAVAARLEAGTVTINDALVAAGIAEVPHGGVKASGSGRSHGAAGLLECVRTKAIVADRLPGARQPWWFGYGREHAADIDAFVRFWHAPSLRERLGGAWRSAKMLFVHERPI
jgi:succinate-semialdehyde dehydrogenase/glutarate-semialdehyde dehydrogenase